MKCKYDNTELKSYSGGGHIFKGYPYESGYYCPECHNEWSDLQIRRGQHTKEYDEKQNLKKYINTPKDISKKKLEDQASILTLHFIGMVAKPIGISEETYQKCREAFSKNRGQFEWEMDSILGVLKNEKFK